MQGRAVTTSKIKCSKNLGWLLEYYPKSDVVLSNSSEDQRGDRRALRASDANLSPKPSIVIGSAAYPTQLYPTRPSKVGIVHRSERTVQERKSPPSISISSGVGRKPVCPTPFAVLRNTVRRSSLHALLYKLSFTVCMADHPSKLELKPLEQCVPLASSHG